MKKNYILLISIGVIVVFVFFFFSGNETQKTTSDTQTDEYIVNLTYDYAKEYIDLRIRTDNALLNARDFESYDAWNDEMTTLTLLWNQMSEHASFLEGKAGTYTETADVARVFDLKTFASISTAHAYTKSEITDVYDRAPAGKKIKTLAKFLGVDARRAFKILKSDQEQVKADAWNEAGDTFRALENSAVVIKDGCKVAGFVGGVIISGGAAGFAGASTVAQGTLIVTGADMVLEITDDAANIGLGDSNKVSTIVGSVRTYTEPLAAILSLNDVAANLADPNAIDKTTKLINKANAVLFEADQIRSIVQDEKILGISFTSEKGGDGKNKTITAAPLKVSEIKTWSEDNDVVDALNDLETQLKYEEFIKDYVAQEKANLITEQKQVEAEADARIEAAEEELAEENDEPQTTNTVSGDNTVTSADGRFALHFNLPAETSWMEGSARLWRVDIEKPDEDTYSYEYMWRFYQNGEQVSEQKGTKGFTSTSASSKAGELRAEFTMTVNKVHYEVGPGGEPEKVVEFIDTLVIERLFEITPIPPWNTHKYGE